MSAEALIPTRRPVPDDLFGGRLRGAYLLDLAVVGARALAPHVRCITVASTDLVDFNYAPGQDLMIEFPDGPRSIRRRYTIRRSDPAAGTADLEFELHPGGGAATTWAANANAGDRLNAIGPRGSITLRPDATSHVFVADDSAIPAACALLEALPSTTSATAVFVTPHQPPSRPGAEAKAELRQLWIARPELLGVAIGSLALNGGVAAYVNGEAHLVRHATELLVSAGVDQTAIASKAYWRHDQPNAPHGEPSHD
jgi:NADPH-dependent ferric siderophore reductase